MWHSGILWKTALCLAIAYMMGIFIFTLIEPSGIHLAWIGAIGVGLPIVLLLSWLNSHAMYRFLRQLRQALQLISQGRFGQQLLIREQKEMSEVLHQFNHMSQTLARQVARLDRDRQELRTVFQCMVEGVIVIDVQQRVQLMNEAACRLLKVTYEESVDRLLWELVRHRPLVDAAEAVLQATTPYRCELALSAREPMVLALQGAPLMGPPLRGALLVIQDITEIRRLEQMRSDFAANVSHELKTPLAAIQACVETIFDGAINEPQHLLRFLHNIKDNADRLHVLVQDLLALNRIESGQTTFEVTPIDVQANITSSLARHEPQAASRQIALNWSAKQEPILVQGNEEALDHILDNLLDNAIKYTPPGGTVTVECEISNPYASIRVIDTGCGIPEKDLTRIFERFYRVDKARSRELGGTGLGLSIVKHMVQALHGKVNAASKIGEGSCFTVMLPLANSELHRQKTDSSPTVEMIQS